MNTAPHTNELIHETSPYLLQHAHNPVNWMPWGEAALQKAKNENKLLLISIGYAACHWCHVMEHESFEDETVAEVMNRHYVCIKVDREERPDVDQIYMTAVQLMTQRGGWPLNAVALPDGRPIWGGTYFMKDVWVNTLQQIAAYHEQQPDKTTEYAEKLTEGITQSSLMPVSNDIHHIGVEELSKAIKSWQNSFDFQEGGSCGAPKFMMPVNLQFLLRWAHQQNDGSVESYVMTTLEKIAFGGIYDQLGGGFARYSTDSFWKVPHFEKMLYDNGQLLSLYAQAYRKFNHELYRQVVRETVDWLQKEMLSPENGFYSSLDADSEGVEGKFYVWQKEELKQLLGEDYELFAPYYNINETGYWEDGNYILLRTQSDLAFANSESVDPETLQLKITKWKGKLKQARELRVRPGLDDKILTSWNALVLSGLAESYKAFGDEEYLKLAEKNAEFLLTKLQPEPGILLHSYKNGIAKIDGFLEDYALLIQALIDLFEVTGKADYLKQADRFCETCFKEFYDAGRTIFYFSADGQKDLISRSIEVQDNVIPASNSVMANNLNRLGHLLGNRAFQNTAKAMLLVVSDNILNYPSGHANWMNLALSLAKHQYEIAIAGENALKLTLELQQNYLPDCLFCPGTNEQLPLLQNRLQAGKTKIYVCENSSCKLPVDTVEETLKLIQS
ncbi:thioredoxin domain-containing protein [Mangrovibacterium lignilyticum]|uniref:thioredoxin domain-containing protein n=1 Tax=Mangrovibacterium lignilyticum TaxID=2668052 RepID=UPI0013D49DCE|nr:thioredoxin domain-containing protein [Mangrovibacterium lignilyticum]